jgi:hypothetical protein
MREGRRVVFVRKEHVQAVEVRFGSPAERPLPQGILGAGLTTLGFASVIFLYGGGIVGLRWYLGSLFFGAIGLWILWEALSRRSYLRVICSNDERKLVFSGIVRQKSELLSFLQSATQFGYSFKHCFDEKEMT